MDSPLLILFISTVGQHRRRRSDGDTGGKTLTGFDPGQQQQTHIIPEVVNLMTLTYYSERESSVHWINKSYMEDIPAFK